ncbi:MAG: carbon-nitrogen hydrolase family protein [Eubacteriales bacterium]
MSSFKVGIVQMHVADNVEENIQTALSMVRDAKEHGADIVCLPEMFSCPYKSTKFPIYGEEQGGRTYTALQRCAIDNNIILVGGSVPELYEGKVYNTSYIFNEKGELIGKHRKMHLYDVNVEGGICFMESASLSAGDNETIFETNLGTFGIGICYDIRFPEYSRILSLSGAKVIFLPAAFNMTSGPAHWDINLRCRAFENQVYLVGVSTARDTSANYVAYGHSMVVSPWGEIITQLDEKPGVAIAEINLDYVDKIRKEFPLLEHRRSDLYEIKMIKKK